MATAFKDPQNNGQSTLNGGINNSVTSITVANGAKFITPINGYWAAIWNLTLSPDPGGDPGMEIVRVTAKAGNVLTVVRGQLGTAAAAHSSGDFIAANLVDQFLKDIHTAVNTLEAGAPANSFVKTGGFVTLGATSPTAGQAIVAIDANSASWQTIAAGLASSSANRVEQGTGSAQVITFAHAFASAPSVVASPNNPASQSSAYSVQVFSVTTTGASFQIYDRFGNFINGSCFFIAAGT